MMEQIRQLKKKQRTLAINILKSTRREALKSLLRDAKKVRRIKVHSLALVEKRRLIILWKKKTSNHCWTLSLAGV